MSRWARGGMRGRALVSCVPLACTPLLVTLPPPPCPPSCACAAGTFADPLPLAPPPSTSPWLSIRDGQRELAAAAATLCRYRLDTWAAQRKLVLAYHEALADTGGRAPPGGVRPLQVGLCTASDDYVLDL